MTLTADGKGLKRAGQLADQRLRLLTATWLVHRRGEKYEEAEGNLQLRCTGLRVCAIGGRIMYDIRRLRQTSRSSTCRRRQRAVA